MKRGCIFSNLSSVFVVLVNDVIPLILAVDTSKDTPMRFWVLGSRFWVLGSGFWTVL